MAKIIKVRNKTSEIGDTYLPYTVELTETGTAPVELGSATATAQGVVELATSTEVIAGSDNERAVTPAGLAALTASSTRAGLIELAIDGEAVTGTATDRAITPANLAAAVATHVPAATTSVDGKIGIATDAQAKAGAQTGKALCAANLTQADGVITHGSLVPMFTVRYSCVPLLGTEVAVHAAITMPDAGTTEVTTAITSPDVPRILSVKGNAAGINGNVIIDGTSFDNTAIQDTIALSDATEVFGIKAFKTVTKITVPVKNAAGDTVSVGTGAKFGLPHILENATFMLIHNLNGATDAGTTTVNAALEQCLYATSGAVDHIKVLDLIYLV